MGDCAGEMSEVTAHALCESSAGHTSRSTHLGIILSDVGCPKSIGGGRQRAEGQNVRHLHARGEGFGEGKQNPLIEQPREAKQLCPAASARVS
jgi:hypothetical protein